MTQRPCLTLRLDTSLPRSGLQLSHLSQEGDQIAKVLGTVLSSQSCYGTRGSAWEGTPMGVGSRQVQPA